MTRRFIKNVTIDSLGTIKPKVVGVVSTGTNIQLESESQNYFKRNYLDVMRKITPAFYFADDAAISGTGVNVTNQLINSHILVNDKISTILPVSALTYDLSLSSIDAPSGFSRFFYKQHTPASINPDDFQRNILQPLGYKYSDYGTSSAFLNFVSGTLLPRIPLVAVGTTHATDDLAALTSSKFASDSSGTYSYLVRNLGWVYFLNRKATTWDDFTTSNAVATLIAENLWQGRSIELADSLNIFQEYLWRQESTLGISSIIPTSYASGTSTSAGTYTSGTQLLDRLKTLNEVVYSPHYLDAPDRKVEEAFTTYLNTNSLITETEELGVFTDFLRGMSYSFADRVTEGNELNVLYDISKCPDQYLELLAELIGWRLIGADVDKWRVQISNAVKIYKQKGTKGSIQLLLDTLFAAGVFNVTTGEVITELWESYIPDLIYFSLATSSDAFQDGFNSYTPEVAEMFGVSYSKTDMETNIKYVVDRILFDLIREYPHNFRLGTKPFPTPRLVFSGTDVLYAGAYHVHGKRSLDPTVSSHYMTGERHTNKSKNLELKYDPNFTFFYRDKINYIPPYEKRKYYTQTQVSPSLVDRIESLLRCYGVSKPFAKVVTDYIRQYTTQTVDPIHSHNSFLMFTTEGIQPPNYAQITKRSSKQNVPDSLSLLSMWNGKSSHFYLSFDASSFNWAVEDLRSNSSYGLKNVQPVIDQVIPAHAIPATILTVSTVDDSVSGVKDDDCREIRPNFFDLYEGSSTVTTNYGTCAVDMGAIATTLGLTPHRFKRGDVDKSNDLLLAAGATGPFIAVPRNSLRRRNYHFLLPETKMFTRTGRNNPGSLELSSSYYSSSVGYVPLGFIPSSLSYQSVALTDPSSEGAPSKFGPLLDHPNIHGVWGICQNLLSPSSFFNYDVSNTFASRAKEDLTSSDCHAYGRRGQLPEILYMMNKLNDKKKYLYAESIVSGYHEDDGEVSPLWPSSSPEITPNDLSAWYEIEGGGANAVRSIGNQLINNNIADESLHYLEHFTFGRGVNKLFTKYISPSGGYGGHVIRNDHEELGGPNIFSHTYGPLIYNSNFDIDGSSINASGFLQASSAITETNLAYFGGSGVLSISGTSSSPTYYVGTVTASDSNSLYLGHSDVSSPEFRNEHIVSAIELVDTSTPLIFTDHPIFSVFKLVRERLDKFSFSKYLLGNTIIKYQRSEMASVLPRLRIKLDNSNSDNKARNFLEPNHKYRIDVEAHNLSLISNLIGGQSLGVWIHTEPEDGKIWCYRPYGYDDCGKYIDAWEQYDASTFNSNGVSIAQSLADVRSFPVRGLHTSVKGVGNGMNLVLKKIDTTCWDTFQLYTQGQIQKMNSGPILGVKPETREKLTYRLTTNNDKASHPSPKYEDKFGPVHRLDQKYVVEIFVMQGNADKFVVFENIAIRDLTNKALAVLPTTIQKPVGIESRSSTPSSSWETSSSYVDLDEFDLATTFRYWKELKQGINSRNATITSGTMEVSGGSRLNYRSNVTMYPYVRTVGNNALSSIDIVEG